MGNKSKKKKTGQILTIINYIVGYCNWNDPSMDSHALRISGGVRTKEPVLDVVLQDWPAT